MLIIAEKLGRHDKSDRLLYQRKDGSSTGTAMPRQGILPHDLVHYVVETELGLPDGFTGLVAQGASASFATETTHELAGKVAGAQALQVESIVEALQSQLWNGQFNRDDFVEGVRTACQMREAPVADLGDAGERLFAKALALNAAWSAIPFHGKLTLEFSVSS